MSLERASVAGRAAGQALIDLMERTDNQSVTVAYAAGIAAAARDYVYRSLGPTAAYEMCQEMADEVIAYTNKKLSEAGR